MNQCYLFPSDRSPVLIVRRSAAIGDAICASTVAQALSERGYSVTFQTHPDIHAALRHIPYIARVESPGGYAHVNLDGAYEGDPLRRQKHFHAMMFARATEHLRRVGISLGQPFNCRPSMRVRPNERQATLAKLSSHARPWVMVCPRSDSYAVRQVPDGIWAEAAKGIEGTCFWIGRHPGPKGFVDLQCRNVEMLVQSLAVADLAVSVDTGPLHIALALGVPAVAIGQSSNPELHFNDQNDFVTLTPPLPCLGCMENICPKNQWEPLCQKIDPLSITQAANRKLEALSGESISAVVAIYQPKVEVLNKCLSCLVDQVDEVVVASEANSVIPLKAMQHPKIRYVRTWRKSIGFSGNANFGARHTKGAWLLFLNDDCFLEPGAVQKMREAAKPDTGILCNLLYYPDRTIYHAGKTRSAGVRGWGHIDYRQRSPTYTGVTELENCCGCCVLTRRKVFYQAGCYDEEMPLFGQDDAYALSVRRNGWKILFVPQSVGIHMEHQSVNKVGNISDLVTGANSVFHRKWGAYLDHNLNRVPFGNFNY